jgi:hypothetical protein
MSDYLEGELDANLDFLDCDYPGLPRWLQLRMLRHGACLDLYEEADVTVRLQNAHIRELREALGRVAEKEQRHYEVGPYEIVSEVEGVKRSHQVGCEALGVVVTRMEIDQINALLSREEPPKVKP